MFGVKTDFGMIGRLFGVPREWLSRIGAFCSSWKTEGRIIKLILPDFPGPSNPIVLSVDEEAIKELCESEQLETPENPQTINSGITEWNDSTRDENTYSPVSNGLTLNILTRVRGSAVNESVCIYCRPVVISEDGRICSIGEETGVQVY